MRGNDNGILVEKRRKTDVRDSRERAEKKTWKGEGENAEDKNKGGGEKSNKELQCTPKSVNAQLNGSQEVQGNQPRQIKGQPSVGCSGQLPTRQNIT